MKTPTSIQGVLEIDHERGVIYFHAGEGSPLRICHLPTPIPTPTADIPLDITFGVGVSWARTLKTQLKSKETA